MSYDIRFGVKVAGADDCYAVIGSPEYDCPTYNLRDIFVQSMDWDYQQGEWYRITEVLPKIQHGITELTLHPQKYKKLEPDNGWGTVGSAVKCGQMRSNVCDHWSIISVTPTEEVWAAVGMPMCR